MSEGRPVALARRGGGRGLGKALGRPVLLGLGLVGGCVYPATEPTGMELSWRFVENNEVDGEEAVMVRSCAGAGAEQIAVEVEDMDMDSPARQGIFRFDCIEGYQTVNALQTEASNAFVRLDPGAYTVSMHAVDDAHDASESELVETRDVTVEERIITIATWELRRAPVDWSIELRGADTCDSMTLALYYATPQNDLADYAPDEEQSLLLYRRTLVSDRGLMLGGEATACGPELSGVHVVEGLDRGEYRLEIVVDGASCGTQSVSLGPGTDAAGVIDLANLPCDG